MFGSNMKRLQGKISILLEMLPLLYNHTQRASMFFVISSFVAWYAKKQLFDKGWQWPSCSCSCFNVVKTYGTLLLLSSGFCSLFQLRTTFSFPKSCWNQNTAHCKPKPNTPVSLLRATISCSWMAPQQDCTHWAQLLNRAAGCTQTSPLLCMQRVAPKEQQQRFTMRISTEAGLSRISSR